MTKVHTVWQGGDPYEPDYIVAAFSTPELAEAYVKLHDCGRNGDHYYAEELKIDDAPDLELIERGMRPWDCVYFYANNQEWNPEDNISIEPVDVTTPEKEPTYYSYEDRYDVMNESWEVTVIQPTAEKARESAAKWMTLWRDLGLGEVAEN